MTTTYELVCMSKNQVVMRWPLLSGPGEIIRVNQNDDGFASADIARIRLRAIIASDREAVPCGRWVKAEMFLWANEVMQWANIGMSAFKAGDMRLFSACRRNIKPRYRWEVRR